MKYKRLISIGIIIIIVPSLLFGLNSYHNSKAQQEIVTSIIIFGDALDELYSRLSILENGEFSKEEREITSTTIVHLTKQSYMIGAQLANYNKSKHQLFHDSFTNFAKQLDSLTARGDREKAIALIKAYKNEVKNFKEEMES